jgi:hypothetical protein
MERGRVKRDEEKRSVTPGRLTDAVPNPFGSKLYSARIAFWSTEAPNMQEDRVGLFRPKMQHPQGMAGSACIPRTWPDAEKKDSCRLKISEK